MIKFAVNYDLSGLSYDSQYPTREMESLAYRLNCILDDCKDNGLEVRMTEGTDVTDMETAIKALYDALVSPPETPLEMTTPTNTDMLLDNGLYEVLNKARVSWLESVLDRVRAESGESPVSDVAEILSKIEEIYRLSLNKEEVLALRDGTPIFWRSGLIGGGGA